MVKEIGNIPAVLGLRGARVLGVMLHPMGMIRGLHPAISTNLKRWQDLRDIFQNVLVLRNESLGDIVLQVPV